MRNLFCLLGTLFLMFLYTDASAQNINDYKWLEGRYTNDAEVNVERMGFVRADALQKGRDLYEYYWNTDDKFCLAMVSHLGRIDRVFKGTRSDCNQKNNAGGIAAVGAMAAAILGSALLKSKSNERENHVDNDNADEVAAFDRGYRDGLYNHTYHNVYRDTGERNAYSKGYNEGTDRRRHETSHNHGYGQNIGHVYIGDLYNKNYKYVENQMRARGFDLMDKQTNNWGKHEYWYSDETHQCYDLTITDQKGLTQIRTAQAYHCQSARNKGSKAKTTADYKKIRYNNRYDDTGTLRCEINYRGENCEYGVVRHGWGRADVYVKLPNGSEQVFQFNGNRVGTPGGGMSINKTGDTWHLKVGSNKFGIPQSIINGR